jgi:hypothetical protein
MHLVKHAGAGTIPVKIISIFKKMGNLKKLSRAEMKNVRGGGTCCWHTTNWVYSQCGLSMADAKAAAGGDILWCCQSCPQT